MWKDILLTFLSLLGGTVILLVKHAWNKYAVPWLDSHELKQAAFDVVRAVEAEFGRHDGGKKWIEAIKQMTSRGFNTDIQEVKDTITAAWFDMNLDQIMTGIKELEE